MDEEDLFQLLDIPSSATDQEVKKAYRKKALTCHPDKCDGPDAAALFGRYKKAAEVLLDPEARKSYERVLRARKERQERDNSLDSTRKKFKFDLEAREKAFDKNVKKDLDDKAKLAAEIARLQKEGSRELEKENEKLKKLIAQEKASRTTDPIAEKTVSGFQVKVSWKGHLQDLDDKQVLDKLKLFGTISSHFLSSRKKRGIVEFANKTSAEAALKSLLVNEFKITPLFDVAETGVPQASQRVPSAEHCMPASFGTSDFEKGLLEQLERRGK